jgi:metal-dependent hydrolase (beta-lactamase superfamily II)
MVLKSIYDNEALDCFRGSSGFSCLVEEKRIIIDTGSDVSTLLFNTRRLAVNTKNIDKIVLSHEHGDHVADIQILDQCGEAEVFIPRSFSSRFKGRSASQPNISINQFSEAEEIR